MFDPSSVKPPPAGSLSAELDAQSYDRLHGFGQGVMLVSAYEHKFNERPPLIGVNREIWSDKMHFTLWAGVGEKALYSEELKHDELEGVRQFCESLTQHGYEETTPLPLGNTQGWRLKSLNT